MSIIAKDNSNGTYIPCPAGPHQAVCVDVVDLGLLEQTWNGQKKTQHKVRVVWQTDEPMADGKPFLASKRYTLSLNEKASLRHDLEAWRGRPFTGEELKGFDVETVIGANCQINVQHVDKGGTVYANVISIMPLTKGMVKLQPKDYVRVKDRAADGGTPPEEGGMLSDDDIPF